METMYDVVIAGSGLGGLICGYVLSKEGYKVCILEKHNQIGGCLQSFKRNNCIFDTGMHYIGSLDEGQIMRKFFNFFKLTDSVKLKKMDEDVFDLISIAGDDYKFAQGYNNFASTLLQRFPHEKQSLEKYVNMLGIVSQSTKNLINSTNTDTGSFSNMKFYEKNALEFIQSLTHNKRLQQVLSATNPLHFGRSDKTSLYVHMIVNNSMIESAWRIVDGGNQISDSLAGSIVSAGGTILKNCEVTKFKMNSTDTHIESVELSNGEHIHGKYFISNIHPEKTFQMTESSLIRNSFLKRLHSIEQTTGIFTIYAVLHENAFPYLNYNVYHYRDENVWVADYNQIEWPNGYMMYTPANSKSDTFADCITIMTYMNYEDVSAWVHTKVEKRGQEYKDFKQQKAEKLLDLIENKYPNIRSAIKTYYTSTPLTYRDYTGTVNGSTYGIMRDCNNALRTMITPKTKIPNLFLTGQNINLHGVMGVTIGSFLTLSNFVGNQYIKEKVMKE